MDRQPKRLIDQLQNIQLRQRKVIQQLQAENIRLLSDLADLRHERDAFREKAALARRENVDLQNKLEKASTEYQDLRRGRTMLVRSATSVVDTGRRSASLSSKVPNMLSVVNEGLSEPSPTAETATCTTTNNFERATRPGPLPNRYKGHPDASLSEPPRINNRVSAAHSLR